ncbi:MAG TPA: hypothetical protein DCY88_32490 [Cyanobacteria bacterium UBA11372]|nr:hypothetical protein [Cyanobacteria bacterium UBA11372]
MKRTISQVIALTVSFVMMFSSIAKAEEIKVPISVSALEPTKLEVVKFLAAKTNKTDCLLAQAKASGVLQGKQMGDGVEPQTCNKPCPPDGRLGYYIGQVCVPCGG